MFNISLNILNVKVFLDLYVSSSMVTCNHTNHCLFIPFKMLSQDDAFLA